MTSRRLLIVALAAIVGTPALVSAQELRGRINGTVHDGSGALLPGTATASGEALIQPQVTVTGTDSGYRLIALPAGSYDVSFELPGFRTLKREGIRVLVNQTLTVNAVLEIATVQETVTVSGESPVDVFNVTNNGAVTTFRTLTATNFKEVTELLDARIMRLGIRLEF